MIFNAQNIELERADAWYLPELEQEIGYDRLASVYSRLADCLEDLVDVEFARLAVAQERGLSLDEALVDPAVHVYETAHLASMVVASRGFLTGYYGADLVNDK